MMSDNRIAEIRARLEDDLSMSHDYDEDVEYLLSRLDQAEALLWLLDEGSKVYPSGRMLILEYFRSQK